MIDLNLDLLVSDKYKKSEPTEVDFIKHLFFEKGIGYFEFNKLPLPYIFNIIDTYTHINKKDK